MTNYEALRAYAAQLTGDPAEGNMMIAEAISDAIELKIAPDDVHNFIFVTVRNKCEDYRRWKEDPEIQAAALGVSIGGLRQEVRAIREGRVFF